jgi:PAS domain S-box-containing protein
MFGYARQELIGQEIAVLLPERFRDEHREHYQSFFSDPLGRRMAVGLELCALHQDGREFPVEINLSTIQMDQEALAISMIRDLTVRKQAEETLRLQSAALESAANSIMIADADGGITWTNPAFTRLTGYTFEEAAGQNPRFLKSGRHDEPFYRDLWQTILSGQVWHGELINRRKDGTLYSEEMTIAPVRDERGGVSHFIAIKQDITERQQVEETLRQRTAELERSNTLIAALSQMARRLQATLDSDRILETMGDELGRLGIKHFLALLDPKDQALVVRYTSIESKVLSLAEKLAGLSARGFRIPRSRFPIYDELVERGRPQFIQQVLRLVDSMLPGIPRGVRERIVRLVGIDPNTPAIYLPLSAEEQVIGTLTVWSGSLREEDIPALSIFAGQVAAALKASQLYEQAQTEIVQRTEAEEELIKHRNQLDELVTERTAELREANEALRRSQERLQYLVSASPVVIYSAEAGGNYDATCITENVKALLGYEPQDFLEIPGFWAENIHPEDAPRVLATLPSLFESGHQTHKYRFRHKDGTYRWMHDELKLTRDAKGDPVEILGYWSDITERRKAEEALQESQRRLANLMANLPGMAYRCRNDPHWTMEFVSEGSLNLTGYEPAELIENHRIAYAELIHPDDRESVWEQVQAAVQHREPFEFTYRITTAGGEEKWVWERGNAVVSPSSELLALEGFISDVTERTRAEEALRESEEKFRSIVEQSSDGIVLTDEQGIIIEWNQAQEGITGLKRSEVLRRPIWDVQLELGPQEDHNPAAREQLKEVTLRALEVEQAPRFYRLNEREIHRPDGTRRFVQTMAYPIKTGSGFMIGNTSRDVSALKATESALRAERATLARRVAERTAELSAANAELARAARLKDEFLASMSHELRTPLNAILGLSEALQEQVYGPLNEMQLRSLHTIAGSGRHLLELINDILDVSKIEAGKLKLELTPVSVEAVCQASLGLVKQTAHKKRLKVSSTVDSAITTIAADERRLKQILVNLLSNAVKFTPEGGEIGLEVIGDPDREVVHLTVWDTGVGIAQEDVGRLFRPFVQLDSSLSRQHPGTGLGLALVSRLAEMHGGGVSLESEVGQGSRFTVSLPWQGPTAAVEAGKETDRAELGADLSAFRRALVVEDSASTASQLVRYLAELGLGTIVHPRGDEAVGKALEVEPDVIILDVLLPGLSGWDVLTQLKEEPATRDIPVLIASVVDEQSQGMALGAAGYLVKPISRDRLERALINILRQGRKESKSQASIPEPGGRMDPVSGQPLILLAEDNEDNINTVSDYLLAKGYRVIVARNGAEAIERAREERPDLILMDIQMPGMDGLEAIGRIRAEVDPSTGIKTSLADVPIIALTALAMPGDRDRCLAAGADEYLSKPVSLKGLVETIQTQLKRSAQTGGA